MSSEKRLAIAAQATPTGDGAIVLDDVIALIDSIGRRENEVGRETGGHPAYASLFHPAGLLAVREDLIARAEVGALKYGTKLRVNNGRRAIVDMYQEVLDGLMYSQQARKEGDKQAGTYVELLLNIAAQIAAELDRR